MPSDAPPGPDLRTAFAVFNEIAILAQLSRALFEARLPEGAHVPHFGLVSHLTRVADGRTPLELARAFQVPKTTMSHTVGGAQRLGLVELRANPEDGRSKRVWLTEAGRRFRADAVDALAPDLVEILDGVGPDLLAELLPRLQALREDMDARRSAQPANGSAS
jgi:DNA-binding MarR family transcriptional regulator